MHPTRLAIRRPPRDKLSLLNGAIVVLRRPPSLSEFAPIAQALFLPSCRSVMPQLPPLVAPRTTLTLVPTLVLVLTRLLLFI